MAITTGEQTQIFELVVLMFDAAPGATYLPLINAQFEAVDHDLSALGNFLDDTAPFLALHPAGESAAAFADAFLAPLGLQDDALARSFVMDKVNASYPKGFIAFDAWRRPNTWPPRPSWRTRPWSPGTIRSRWAGTPPA